MLTRLDGHAEAFTWRRGANFAERGVAALFRYDPCSHIPILSTTARVLRPSAQSCKAGSSRQRCAAMASPKLPRRKLGNTGLEVSVIGFGASPLGGVFEVGPVCSVRSASHEHRPLSITLRRPAHSLHALASTSLLRSITVRRTGCFPPCPPQPRPADTCCDHQVRLREDSSRLPSP